MNVKQWSIIIYEKIWIQAAMDTTEQENIIVQMVLLSYIHCLTLKRPWTQQLAQQWFFWCYHSKLLVFSRLKSLHTVLVFLLMLYFPRRKEQQSAVTSRDSSVTVNFSPYEIYPTVPNKTNSMIKIQLVFPRRKRLPDSMLQSLPPKVDSYLAHQ
jgi:hypothetical protein